MRMSTFFCNLQQLILKETMEFIPKDIYEKLEFNKVIVLLQNECLGEAAKEKLSRLRPETLRFMIEQRLKEVHELKEGFDNNENFPFAAYKDISKDLKMLKVIDYVLPIEGLQKINNILRVVGEIYRFFNQERQESKPTLFELIRDKEFNKDLMVSIDKVIDEEGRIKPNASPELLAISKTKSRRIQDLDKVFRKLIIEYRQRGWLKDTVESFRNGRRVLTVPSEHKRKIRGIIHDESTTGKTAFIEPEAIIDINNDIFDLETEEKREIYRILKNLSEILRPYIPLLKTYQELLVHFDIVRTKALLARRMDAHLPKLMDGPKLNYKKAFHPLLFLKNKAIAAKTVPFDLEMKNDNRILMLSGPNAGGKSITMKTVGLLQLMVQSGLLIPADPESEVGIFENIFADIGDQQSLEDDLSTYSSRLQNMKGFLEKADEKTLILIDEFGSGTDPVIGGAIAEGILKDLNERKVFGVITTHYSNLKTFAFQTKGILNGSMNFDKANLKPTYDMIVGRPGSSYAFEIAHKTGLQKTVLDYAKKRAGKSEKAVDELLADLQQDKKELMAKVEKMMGKERKLESLIKNYETLHKDLEYKRKKHKMVQKESNLQQVARDNKELEKLIREIREEGNLEKAKELATKVREERKQLTAEVAEIQEEVYHKEEVKKIKHREIVVGDFVKLKTGGAEGQVMSIKKNKVQVQSGILQISAHMRDLELTREPLPINPVKSVNFDSVKTDYVVESKIDIRGMRYEEALQTIELLIDQALMSSVEMIEIVHGKGNGTLRKAVKKKLKEFKGIKKIWHPEGNDGVTFVSF